MGFKCPVCFEDFKRDKTEWKEHMRSNHKGLGEDIHCFMITNCEEVIKEQEEGLEDKRGLG